jgi:hypothetical protein
MGAFFGVFGRCLPIKKGNCCRNCTEGAWVGERYGFFPHKSAFASMCKLIADLVIPDYVKERKYWVGLHCLTAPGGCQNAQARAGKRLEAHSGVLAINTTLTTFYKNIKTSQGFKNTLKCRLH